MMNFTLRNTEERTGAPAFQNNPYLAARREWDERYGEQITRARNWRMMAMLSAVIALLATSGMVWLSARSHVVPFVVLVDSLSRPVASGIAERASGNDDRLKRASIFTWVENLRLVTTDGVSQRRAIDRVYSEIANGTAAQTFISDFYRADPPSKRAQTETVSVEVTSVLPTSDRSYEVEWNETTRDLYGAVKSTDRWKGSFSVVINRREMSARRASIQSGSMSPMQVGRKFYRRSKVPIIKAGILINVAALLFGQQAQSTPPKPSKAPALEVHREPSGTGAGPANQSIPPLLQQYDFGAQLNTLNGGDPLTGPDALKPEFAAPAKSISSQPGVAENVPKDFRPNPDVPLSSTAMEAVRVSERWRGEKNSPAAGTDGRVLYSFGAGLPTVVCAPLRVCMIELQAGEKIVGEPQIGDSVRWNISPALYGTGDQATAVIVLKPQTPGLDTNLLVTTDRRAYYLRLISKAEDYVARVAFAYPDDESRKWQQQMADQKAQAKQEKRAAEAMPAAVALEKINFSYTVKGGNDHIRPVRVFDDGAKTYIQMPAELRNREAPALVVLGADGKGEMTNYRVRDQLYIVDRLFDRANLVLGSGKKAQKVEISRGEPKG